MLNIHSKQSETDGVKSEMKHANIRLDAVEAKIGGMGDVAERLSVAVRPLPLPAPGLPLDSCCLGFVFPSSQLQTILGSS